MRKYTSVVCSETKIEESYMEEEQEEGVGEEVNSPEASSEVNTPEINPLEFGNLFMVLPFNFVQSKL